jgi:hypothetical protein
LALSPQSQLLQYQHLPTFSLMDPKRELVFHVTQNDKGVQTFGHPKSVVKNHHVLLKSLVSLDEIMLFKEGHYMIQ